MKKKRIKYKHWAVTNIKVIIVVFIFSLDNATQTTNVGIIAGCAAAGGVLLIIIVIVVVLIIYKK